MLANESDVELLILMCQHNPRRAAATDATSSTVVNK